MRVLTTRKAQGKKSKAEGSEMFESHWKPGALSTRKHFLGATVPLSEQGEVKAGKSGKMNLHPQMTRKDLI